MKPIAIALPDDLIVRLDAAAAAADRSRSHMVRQLIEVGFATRSDFHHSSGPIEVAAMSGESNSHEQLRRDQLAAAARAIAARLQPKPDPKEDKVHVSGN